MHRLESGPSESRDSEGSEALARPGPTSKGRWLRADTRYTLGDLFIPTAAICPSGLKTWGRDMKRLPPSFMDCHGQLRVWLPRFALQSAY
jgi:hypothetical protein